MTPFVHWPPSPVDGRDQRSSRDRKSEMAGRGRVNVRENHASRRTSGGSGPMGWPVKGKEVDVDRVPYVGPNHPPHDGPWDPCGSHFHHVTS